MSAGTGWHSYKACSLETRPTIGPLPDVLMFY